MCGLGTYEFKYLNAGEIIPVELFMNTYAEGINESKKVRASNKILHTILDDKYKKEYLNRVMKKKSII